MINFRILGSVSIQKENEEFERSFLTGPKRLALFTYLLLARPRGFHRRDKLIAIFWPEMGQKNARNALSNLLYNIRDALGKEVITNRGTEEITINRNVVWCDVIAFEEALDKGELPKAFELYKGNLLQGLHVKNISNDFQDWLDRERERLRERAAYAASSLAEKQEQAGNLSYAIEMAARAKKLMPLSREHQSSYVKLLVRNELPCEALKAYKEYKLRLESDLGVQPPGDLQLLIANLKKKESSLQSEKTDDGFSTEEYSQKKFSGDGLEITSPQDQYRVQPEYTPSYSGDIEPDTASKKFWLPVAIAGSVLVLFFSLYTMGWQSYQNNPVLSGEEISVAVLPFTYINDPDSIDYFSIGMTEEILAKLARVPDLSVISRTSVMQYREFPKGIREIGRELRVNAVVEGSVQRVGDQVRITAKLINADTDHNIWTKSYDRRMENILSMQNEVATHIADALQAKLLPRHLQYNSDQRDLNEPAYHLYLRAKYLLDINEPSSVVEAVKFFEQSVELDSTFAPAYSELALARLRSGRISKFDKDVTGVEGIPIANAETLAMEASEQALALDSTMVSAHLVQAMAYESMYRDWERSKISFKRALELNPSHSETLIEYGWHYLRVGDIDNALIQMKKALTVDPVSWAAHHGLGYAYYCERNYEDAITELVTSLNLGSLYPNTKKYLSTARLKRSQQLFIKGREAEAIALIENASVMLNDIWGHKTGWKKTIIHAAMGERTETIKSFNNDSLPAPPRLYSSLLIGEREVAFQLIDQNLRFNHRVYIDPIFDSIRSDKRFKALIEKKLKRKVDLL